MSTKQKYSTNTTLELRRVPADMNNIARINEHFTKFGTLVNLQVRLSLRLRCSWFGIEVTTIVTSMKLCYVEPGYYLDWWQPLAGLQSRYLSTPIRPAQPGHPSMGRCNEDQRWFRPSRGRNSASKVTTLWHVYE